MGGEKAKKIVQFQVEYEGRQHLITTFPNEYRNLMVLIYDKLFLDEFGECRGMGRCGTCLVKVNNHLELNAYDRNEEATINKLGMGTEGVRLSCQILADEKLDGQSFTILEQS
jgi:2Fe-2S ferredoxin